MCVAIYIPEDAPIPSFYDLEQMEWSNSDGAGVAWAEDGRCHWKKGLTAEEVHALLLYTEGPRLVHFRFATAGLAGPELTHPFPVAKHARTDLEGGANRVLIHNGHWDDWEVVARYGGPLPGKGDWELDWSDTRLIARLVAMYGEDAVLPDIGGHYNRFATLNAAGHVRLWGDWLKHEGSYYSNMSWQALRYKTHYLKDYVKDDADVWLDKAAQKDPYDPSHWNDYAERFK